MNPAHAASGPHASPAKIHPPAPTDLVRLFELAEKYDPSFATFLMLAAATGAPERAAGPALVGPGTGPAQASTLASQGRL